MLIVEDDRSARKATAAILKKQGYAVLEAATVAEAMHGLLERPDWILLDLMLPDGCVNSLSCPHRGGGVRLGGV